jgi:hypothetical protein
MTAITGNKCDVCGGFATDRDGWMELKVHGTRPNDGFPDICSNKCLADLALERLKDMDGVDLLNKRKPSAAKGRTRKTYSDDEKEYILLRAEDIGLSKACEEAGVPFTTARNWQKVLAS